MPFDTNDPTYQDLLALVVQPGTRVVPFVGAGLSVYGNAEQRLPLWRDLLERLDAEGQRLGLIPEGGDDAIGAAIASGRYIEAMDRILDALGEPTFRRAVERELDDRRKPTPPAVTELVAISWSLIVSTNLDRLISRGYLERHGRPITAVSNFDMHRLAAALAGTLATPETALAQIHGDIDIYPSWRLTRAHYEQLLRDDAYVEALKHLFLRQIFFVGFGLQDDDFDFLLETISRIYPAGAGEFYALIASSRRHQPVVTRLVRRNGLRPIFYNVGDDLDHTDPFAGHKEVYECLAHLATSWATARTWLDVTLKYFPELDPFLVGHDQDVDRLADLALVDRGSVVQIVGLGGSGKTSIVQQFLRDRCLEIAKAGYGLAFACSFHRADIGQFIQDLVLAVVGPLALPLPDQVGRICAHLRRHRTLLVLDGLEVAMDAGHRVRNPYLVQIVEAVLQGRGSIMITSRVPIRGGAFEHAPVADVTPLSADDIRAFLGRWGISGLDETTIRRLIEITAGHPLALRILAGVLRYAPIDEALSTIERSAVIDIADEVDPLRENRLARILGSYIHHLDEAEIALLTCSTAIEGPAPYPLMEAALARRYPDTSVNEELVDRDLRPIVAGLLERRLLTTSTGGDLTSHPMVREYFARRARGAERSLVPIHRFLAIERLQRAPELPDSFSEAAPLVVACRHAAACKDWTLFDDLFRRRLMRGFRNYLCNNLGAWEEALGLARLGTDTSFPAASTPEPAFYPITVARCLKHLGRTADSRDRYLEGLRIAAATQDPDTAKYVNNLLTLLVWRGELAAADQLVELNIRALSWIRGPWKHRWQVEHGFSTFGYLRMLQGGLDAAEPLFAYSQRAWDGYPDERQWVFDHYPYHRSELVLLADPAGHEEALEGVEALLVVARAHGWPESICRGHVHAALIMLDRAGRRGDRSDVVKAGQRLAAAGSIAAGMIVPDVEISHLLARMKLELMQHDLDPSTPIDELSLGRLVDRADALVEGSGLRLAAPEVVAARGTLALAGGSLERAETDYNDALRMCQEQGNALASRSPRTFVGWLGRRLRRDVIPPSWAPRLDLVGLVGAGLTPEWMDVQLDLVAVV